MAVLKIRSTALGRRSRNEYDRVARVRGGLTVRVTQLGRGLKDKLGLGGIQSVDEVSI